MPGSFPTWLSVAKTKIAASLAIFSMSFVGYSSAHADFAKIVSEIDPCYLPHVELETAFHDRITFSEPATLETP